MCANECRWKIDFMIPKVMLVDGTKAMSADHYVRQEPSPFGMSLFSSGLVDKSSRGTIGLPSELFEDCPGLVAD